MQSGTVAYLLAVACFSLCEQIEAAHHETYGIVTFNMRGVDGTIKFHPLENGSMIIVADLNGFESKHQWHVHNLPVDTSLPPNLRCENRFIGGHYDPLNANNGSNYACSQDNHMACEVGDLSGKFGPLLPNLSVVDNTGNLALFGKYGIVGRSIRIHGEDVCATIYSSSEMDDGSNVALLQASFVYPFGGTIFFKQVDGESTVIFGKVFWTTTSDTTMNHNWHVHVNQPSEEYREGNCDGIGGHFNPYGVDTSGSYSMYCNEDNITICEVGDLSGKLGQIDISDGTDEYSQYAFLFHDNFLNLTGVNAVVNRSIAIHRFDGDLSVQGCAPLVSVETLSVSSTDGVFRSSQMSKFSRTNIEPHQMYNNPDYRILSSAIAPNILCRDAFMAGSSQVYNPHNAPTPDGTDNTPDRYAVGNLTIKHRNIATVGLVDELPIHGIETIAGHSLGISYGDGGSMTYICQTLQPSYPSWADIKMAKATFNGTVTGAIYFTQRDFGNGVYGNTYISVDIWYTDSSMDSTTGHNWHIHENPPVAGQECSAAIGGHFNPFGVDITASSYSDECSVYSQLRCESGDLSGKHGVLNIDPPSEDRESVTYTDPNLNLYGPDKYSIIGRSVGLHLPSAQGGSLFDCGEIQEVFEASTKLSVSFSYNKTFNRVEFAKMMTMDVDGASPSDILLSSQLMMSQDSTRTDCVNADLTVLGTSTSDADLKLQSIKSQVSSDCDSGSGADILLPSVAMLLGILVLITLLM